MYRAVVWCGNTKSPGVLWDRIVQAGKPIWVVEGPREYVEAQLALARAMDVVVRWELLEVLEIGPGNED